jgi:uncharacterized repeat protein (TIGR01451 family)
MRPNATLGSLALALLLASSLLTAQEEGTQPIHLTNAEIMAKAAQRPKRSVVQDREVRKRKPVRRQGLPQNPDSPPLSRWAPALRAPEPRLPQAVGTNFTSVRLSEALAQPPDSMGAVGPTQYLTHVNGRIRVHAKANGTIGALDADDANFWSAVMTPGAGTFVSDPRVRYDRLTDRWFTLIIDVPGNLGTNAGVSNRILLAVSDSSTVTGASGWRFHYFNIDAAPPAGDNACLADYPTLGLDANALYIGVNTFCGPDLDNLDFSNTTAYVVRKSTLLSTSTPANLAATAGAVTAFRGLVNPGSGVGLYTPQGVDNDSPSATVGYLVGVDFALFGRLVLRTVSNPGSGAPSLGPNVLVTVPATEFPIDVVTPGGGLALDGIDDRLMNAVLRGNTVWTSHQIQVDAAGSASQTGGRNGTRWYAIDVAGGSAAQVGTIFDSAVSNPRSYFMAGVGVSGQGHVAFGATVAGAATAPGAATVGRLASDPVNTTQGTPTVYKAAEGNYVQGGAGPSARWGDYSMTTLDPCDDMSLWTIQEFGAASNNWGTQVARLLAPPPSAPATTTPSLAAGQSSVRITLTGTGWYNPPTAGMSSCRTGIAVAVGGGVTVNSVTYVSPTRVDVDLNTVSAPAGAKSVTLTNPDGQFATATNLLNVVSVPVVTATKTVAANPAGPFVPGGAITYTITLRNTGTFTQGDNAGNELTDVLPSTLTLVSASATSGTAVATVGTNTVTWNGAIASGGGTVTLIIQATIKLTTPGGALISNQGTVSYDGDANGTNEAAILTDDPGKPGTADPTVFSTAARFYTLTPCRLVDTRGPMGPRGAPALSPGPRTFTLANVCGLPTGAGAVSLNVTITSPTHAGNLRIYPGGPTPLVSVINYAPGQTRANNAIAVLSSTGAVTVQCDQAGGSVELILDINGYFR